VALLSTLDDGRRAQHALRLQWRIGTALVALWWLSVVSVDAGEVLHGVSGGAFAMTTRGYVTFLMIVFLVGPLGLWLRRGRRSA